MPAAATSAIPPDDPARKLTVAERDSPGIRHVALVGDTYSILVSGADTGGKYCLIDMAVPDGGGPPPHRHDYEEVSRCSRANSSSHFAASRRPSAPDRR